MKIQYYNTEKEAKEILIKMDKTPKFFCPLIDKTCRLDCLCYVEAHTLKQNIIGKVKYRIVEGYCNNAMFQNE